MKLLNRFSMHLGYKQPYLDWYNSIFADEFATLEELNAADSTTYLIPLFDTDEEIAAYLENNYEQFFVDELYAVVLDQVAWPKDLSWEKFNEWFEISINPIVADYGDDELLLDMDEDLSDEFWNKREGGDKDDNKDYVSLN